MEKELSKNNNSIINNTTTMNELRDIEYSEEAMLTAFADIQADKIKESFENLRVDNFNGAY